MLFKTSPRCRFSSFARVRSFAQKIVRRRTARSSAPAPSSPPQPCLSRAAHQSSPACDPHRPSAPPRFRSHTQAQPQPAEMPRGTVSHSACHRPSPRSCSCGMACSIVDHQPRHPLMCCDHRCARHRIVLVRHRRRSAAALRRLPPTPLPLPPASAAQCPVRTSPATRSDSQAPPPSRPGYPAAHATAVPARAIRASAPVPPKRTARLAPSAANVPTAPPNCRTIARSAAASKRSRCRRSAASVPASFKPKVVGGPACSHVLPVITVSRCVRTWFTSAASSLADRAIQQLQSLHASATPAPCPAHPGSSHPDESRAQPLIPRSHRRSQLPHEGDGDIPGISCLALQ